MCGWIVELRISVGKIAGALEKVWKMPSLYGLALALVVRAVGHPVPEAIMRPVDLLSDAALWADRADDPAWRKPVATRDRSGADR